MLPDTHTQPITDSCVQFFTESFHTTYLEVVNPPSYKLVIRLRCFVPTYLSQPSLICDFCPSDQRFAYSFLQILPHDRHPCCSAIHFPLSGRVRDFHPLERAHGAQTQKATDITRLPLCYSCETIPFFKNL